MKLYLLPSDNLLSFVTQLSKIGSVFYPGKEESKAHFVRFDPERKFEPVFSTIRTAENLKHFLFPSRDVVAKFPKELFDSILTGIFFLVLLLAIPIDEKTTNDNIPNKIKIIIFGKKIFL